MTREDSAARCTLRWNRHAVRGLLLVASGFAASCGDSPTAPASPVLTISCPVAQTAQSLEGQEGVELVAHGVFPVISAGSRMFQE